MAQLQKDQLNYIDDNGITICNHALYQKHVKTMDYHSLVYVIKDCQKAIEAMPSNPKAGFYADEICYCGMELKRRNQFNQEGK